MCVLFDILVGLEDLTPPTTLVEYGGDASTRFARPKRTVGIG